MTQNLKRIDLKVGYLCNNHCIHCAIGDNRRDLIEDGICTELTTDQVKQLIDQYCNEYQLCTLTGGEITIRKDCVLLIEYAAQRFKLVEVQTNGRKLSSVEDLDRLIKYNNITFTIALHGSTSEVHDAITQVRHSFEQTINSIKAVVDRFQVIGKFVLTNYNKHQIIDTVRVCSELGCKRLNIAFVHGVGDGRVNYKTIAPTYSEVRQSVNQAIRLGRQLGVLVTTEAFPICMIDSDNYLSIDESRVIELDGDCKPVHEQFYNWNDVRINQNKAHGDTCSKCIAQNVCEGCWKEYFTCHKDDMIAIHPEKRPIPPDTNYHKLFGLLRVLDANYS